LAGTALVRTTTGRVEVDGRGAGRAGVLVGALEWTTAERFAVDVATPAGELVLADEDGTEAGVGRAVRVGSGAKVTWAADGTGMLKAATGSAREAPGSCVMFRATTAHPATAAEAASPPTTRPIMGPVCQM